ncbi:MAG: hypothetical protein U1E42_16280 [Rhodospirillales bacterium]
MKIIAIIAGALGAAAIAITVAVHVIAPDNNRAMEMQRKDIEAMRARAAAAAQNMEGSPMQWGGDSSGK